MDARLKERHGIVIRACMSALGPVQIPFDFVPEFKPQELAVEFILVVNDEQTGKKHRIHAYSGSVQVVEPPKNWFDLQLLSAYLFAAAFVAGIGYLVYNTYVNPEDKTTKKFEKPVVEKPTGIQDEWIVSTISHGRQSQFSCIGGYNVLSDACI